MSITIMAEVWPLEMSPTDKIVLLALADAANDEEGHTWIPVKSKVALNRAGRPKLNLIVKTSLSKRAVQMSLRRLEDEGHISRQEKPGIGVDYWVHPVVVSTGAADAPLPDSRGASDSQTGAGDAPEGGTTCTQIIKNPKQPSAGARAGESRSERPPAGPSGGPATATQLAMEKAQASEGERERALRAAFLERSEGKAATWLDRVVLKVGDLVQAGGPVGLTISAPYTVRSLVEHLEHTLQAEAADVLGVPVRWVAVTTLTVA